MRIIADLSPVNQYLARLRKALSAPDNTEPFFRLSLNTFRRLVTNTPRRRGLTKKGWRIIRNSQVSVENPETVMKFLEYGTKAHGPVRAKMLFIPLNLSAKPGMRGLVRGKDFVLAKRVRGIKPFRLTDKEVPYAERDAIPIFEAYINRIK